MIVALAAPAGADGPAPPTSTASHGPREASDGEILRTRAPASDGDPRTRVSRAVLVAARVYLADMGPSTLPSNTATGVLKRSSRRTRRTRAGGYRASGRPRGDARRERRVSLLDQGATRANAGAAAVIVANDREGGFFKMGYRGRPVGRAVRRRGRVRRLGFGGEGRSYPVCIDTVVYGSRDARGAGRGGGARVRRRRESNPRPPGQPRGFSSNAGVYAPAASSGAWTTRGVAVLRPHARRSCQTRTSSRREKSRAPPGPGVGQGAAVRETMEDVGRAVEVPRHQHGDAHRWRARRRARQYFADGYYPTGRSVPSDGFKPRRRRSVFGLVTEGMDACAGSQVGA